MADIFTELRDAMADKQLARVYYDLIPRLIKMHEDGLIPVLPCKVGTPIFKIQRADCAKCARNDIKTYSQCKIGIGHFAERKKSGKNCLNMKWLAISEKPSFFPEMKPKPH